MDRRRDPARRGVPPGPRLLPPLRRIDLRARRAALLPARLLRLRADRACPAGRTSPSSASTASTPRWTVSTTTRPSWSRWCSDGDELQRGILDVFHDGAYELAGQVSAGFFPVRARAEEGRGVLALTVQAAALAAADAGAGASV